MQRLVARVLSYAVSSMVGSVCVSFPGVNSGVLSNLVMLDHVDVPNAS